MRACVDQLAGMLSQGLSDLGMAVASGVAELSSAADAYRAGKAAGEGRYCAAAGHAVLAVSNRVPVGRLVSRIGDVPGLARIASRVDGVLQTEVDALTSRLAQGNLNPGIGNRHLFNGIFEARGRGGARVYFRNGENGVEVLANSGKNAADQERVISTLRDVYGNK